MAFSSVEGLLQAAGQVPLWRAVLEDDLRERGVDEARSWRQMAALWTAMKAPVAEYDPAARSRSGLTGGAGARLEGEGPGLCPPFLRQVIAAALKTGECNACMKRIVAAPTAGASGVLPAVFLPLQARDGLDDRRMVEALYVAAGFGQVIATRASISGAEGGCQAEVGSASGMAAAALVYVMGGTPGQMAHACAMALSNTLGLVCDPVAGLVEVPCVNRNVMGAVNALSCAEMALSGVESAIPCDEVIDAMRAVGDALPASLRETGSGGLAATPTGRRLAERLLRRTVGARGRPQGPPLLPGFRRWRAILRCSKHVGAGAHTRPQAVRQDKAPASGGTPCAGVLLSPEEVIRMANYTQHYHLHQWEPEDSFLRTDFNGDFQRLDEALAGLDGRKPELRLGRYTGDGTQNRAVALGCAPRAVLLFCRDREALLAWPGAPYVYAYNNRPGNMLILTETGFQVHYDHYEVGLSDNDFLPVTNKAGESYRYLALV